MWKWSFIVLNVVFVRFSVLDFHCRKIFFAVLVLGGATDSLKQVDIISAL